MPRKKGKFYGTEKLIGGPVFKMGKEARRESTMSKGRETANAPRRAGVWWSQKWRKKPVSWETLKVTAQSSRALSNMHWRMLSLQSAVFSSVKYGG